MHTRQTYIKPTLIRLDFTTDVRVISFAGCKTSGSDTGGEAGSGCEHADCQSAGS